ncbi:amino acid/amide ABC transporter substrate-binding protein (HAAT family) [Hoeflea marina]|uniref:Amino acid/amide ABC transporter substrate-binding protein (HAAT family) n=1 Tax=Hoeflea marina TaxID=274592 RepID=A0A317PCZ9_9HYPH|nr:ABC transporter substrate-binding protein [Hoeflea marina]PWV95789.1 amino acid/amide ABC transporter substrate-binding protein (HAAT family) [Hoeflea marina]
MNMLETSKRTLLSAVYMAVALGIAAPAHADPDAGEYRIGMISDDSGPIASAGQSYHQGADIAVAEINSKGLAGEGVTLALDIKDSGSDAARAVQAMTQFGSDRGILATTCCILSAIAAAVSPIAMSNEVPLVIYGATRASLPQEPYVTSVVALPGPQEVAMSERLAAELKPQKVAYFLSGDNDIFKARAMAMKEVIEKSGAATVAEISTLSADTDFTGPATQGIATDPDLIVVMTTQQPTVGIITALRQRGYEGTIVTSEVLSPPAIFKKSGETITGIPFALSFQPGVSDSEAAVAFIDAYKAQYNALPDVYAAQGYMAIQFIAQGLKTLSGKPTRQDLAKAMWGTSDIAVNPYGGQPMESGQARTPNTLIVNWTKDGEVKLWEKP